MLVRRSVRRPVEPERVLASVHDALGVTPDADVERDRWTSCLIDVGALESALVDEWAPERDRWDAPLAALRQLTDRVGDAAVSSWSGRPIEPSALSAAISQVAMLPLPACISVETPAGFANHALFPEMYADAAQRFAVELQPSFVVVIGIRSIGASLSSVVGAVLRQRGIVVRSYTVRPRGHPIAGELLVEDSLIREWLAAAEDAEDQTSGPVFAVVNEGPEPHDVSFAAVSTRLAALGIEPERVVLFPSWEADGHTLRSQPARVRWGLHRRYVGSFDDLYLRTGRLASLFGGGTLTELSAGKWREVFDPGQCETIPVDPLHEQRKFLLSRDDERLIVKFVGLGTFGASRLALAQALARPGFAATPTALRAGMLAHPFVDGRPMTRDDLTSGFLGYAARYLAHRALRERGVSDVGSNDLLQMIAENTSATLGPEEGARCMSAIEEWRPTLDEKAPVRIDGHLMPHEWLCTPTGWTKCDALSHHDDQFLPGCQDIAWDVAAMIDEWSLGPAECRLLIDAYIRESADDRIEARLPIWRVAYLAFRSGYTRLAADTLGDDVDGRRMLALHHEYARKLRAVFDQLPAPP